MSCWKLKEQPSIQSGVVYYTAGDSLARDFVPDGPMRPLQFTALPTPAQHSLPLFHVTLKNFSNLLSFFNLHAACLYLFCPTQPHNVKKLSEAYDSCDEVRLVFSVNSSGYFQGYAKMASKIGKFMSPNNSTRPSTSHHSLKPLDRTLHSST